LVYTLLLTLLTAVKHLYLVYTLLLTLLTAVKHLYMVYTVNSVSSKVYTIYKSLTAVNSVSSKVYTIYKCLTAVNSVLKDYDYPFGIFKLFLAMTCTSVNIFCAVKPLYMVYTLQTQLTAKTGLTKQFRPRVYHS
jgi:hypothetical protein